MSAVFFHDLLKVAKADLSKKVAIAKRLARVQEAINWSSGTLAEPQYHSIWDGQDYAVKLGKPGKEADPKQALRKYKDGRRDVNPNDMRPSIFYQGVLTEGHVASFTDIFDELQKLGDANKEALELIACLLFRSAYMIDHQEVSPGVWRYQPPVEVLQAIVAKLPIADNLPMEVFLHFLDALAWNEDVKYHTLGYDIGGGYGRKNNLLTCVNLIAVLLGRVRISKFAGSFSRPPAGISAISNTEALRVFPLLQEDPA